MIKKPRLEILYPNTPFLIENYPLKRLSLEMIYDIFQIQYWTMSVFHLTSESLNFWKSELNWTELQQLIGVKEKERYQALTHGQ